MAHLHNLNHNQSPGFLHTVGQKVKQTAEIMGGLKAIVDTGIFFRNTFAPAAAVIAAAAI